MDATRNREVEAWSLGEQFAPVPSIAKVKAAMLKNEMNRQQLSFEASGLPGLSAKQVDAVHEIVSSLHFSEAYGGIVCGNLANRIPYRDISEAFTVQMLDESHHTRLVTRYVTEVLGRPILRAPFVVRSANWQLSKMRDPLIAAMAASHFSETGAAEVQRELVAKVDEPNFVELFRLILRDESRHVVLGRETMRFLLESPAYRAGWRRERARLYRYFLEYFSGLVLGRFRKAGTLFGIDVDQIQRNTLERVRETVPF